jgi:hypothetical protein
LPSFSQVLSWSLDSLPNSIPSKVTTPLSSLPPPPLPNPHPVERPTGCRSPNAEGQSAVAMKTMIPKMTMRPKSSRLPLPLPMLKRGGRKLQLERDTRAMPRKTFVDPSSFVFSLLLFVSYRTECSRLTSSFCSRPVEVRHRSSPRRPSQARHPTRHSPL